MSEMVVYSEAETPDVEFIPGDETIVHTAVVTEMDDRERRKGAKAAESIAPEFDKQETIDFLVSYYGDQWFNFMGRQGTVLDVINLCPQIESVIGLGPDYILSWLNPYMAERPVEEKTDEPSRENEIPDDSSDANQDTGKVADKPIVFEKTGVEKPVQLIVEKTKPVATVSLSNVPRVVASAAVIKDIAIKSKDVNKKIDSIVLDEIPSSPAVVPEVPVRKIKTVDLAASIDAPDEVAAPSSSNDQKVENVVDDTELKQQIIELEHGVHFEDFIDVVNDDPVSNSEEAEGDYNQELLDLEEQESPIIEDMTSWRSLAQEDVPLDELLVTVVEQLHTKSNEVLESGDEILEDLLGAEMNDLETPELQTLLIEVHSVKTALRRLYSAETKEECQTHVTEVIVSLAQLLRSFGYGDPEKMIRDFLATHPLMSLQELVDELELSLQRSIRYEALRRKQYVHHKRHSAFGRFVLSVLQSISLKNPLADLSV